MVGFLTSSLVFTVTENVATTERFLWAPSGPLWDGVYAAPQEGLSSCDYLRGI